MGMITWLFWVHLDMYNNEFHYGKITSSTYILPFIFLKGCDVIR